MPRPKRAVLTPTCQVCDSLKGLTETPAGYYCKEDMPMDMGRGKKIGRCKKDDKISYVDKAGFCKDHEVKPYVDLMPGVRFYNKKG